MSGTAEFKRSSRRDASGAASRAALLAMHVINRTIACIISCKRKPAPVPKCQCGESGCQHSPMAQRSIHTGTGVEMQRIYDVPS